MIAITLLVVGLWLTIALVPATPIARFLRHWLIAVPARRLSAIRHGAVILALLIVVTFVVTAWLLDAEAVQLLAMTAPEAATWLTMVEAGTIVDGLIAVMAARTVLRLNAVRAWLASWRSRGRRSHRQHRTPANDQEDDLRRAA